MNYQSLPYRNPETDGIINNNGLMVRPGDKIDVSGTIRTIQYIIEQTAYFKNGIIMDINDVTKFNLIFS